MLIILHNIYYYTSFNEFWRILYFNNPSVCGGFLLVHENNIYLAVGKK